MLLMIRNNMKDIEASRLPTHKCSIKSTELVSTTDLLLKKFEIFDEENTGKKKISIDLKLIA